MSITVETRLFVYGTLRPGWAAFELLLAPHTLGSEPGLLHDHALFVVDRPYPFAVPQPGSTIVGDVLSIDHRRVETLLDRLDEYEGDEYLRVRCAVQTATGSSTAHVYIAAPSVAVEPGAEVASGDWALVSPPRDT